VTLPARHMPGTTEGIPGSPHFPPAVLTRLAQVMDDVKAVAKRETNTHDRYSFRGIDAVLNALGPAFRERKILVQPHVTMNERTEIVVGQNATRMTLVRVEVTYTFVSAEDGSTFDVHTPGEAFDRGDKATSKAMSVAYRTALIQTFALPTDEPDADTESHELGAAGPPAGCSVEEILERVALAQTENDLNRCAVIAAKFHTGDQLGIIRDATAARRKVIREGGTQ
jgi:hypothetical protein